MQMPVLARLGRAALDLVYPPRCAVCGKSGAFLCEACAESLPRAEGRRCNRCWLPLRGPFCLNCTERPGTLERLRSVLRYEGATIRLISAFKFAGQSSLAPTLGNILAQAYSQHELNADAIVPVPLTGARQRIRGYNQALLMARELSKLTEVPVARALRRSGHSRAQAGSASAEERRNNVQGVFALAAKADVRDSHVLLIDDVATTGATLNACAAVLLEAGAASVSGLTLARED